MRDTVARFDDDEITGKRWGVIYFIQAGEGGAIKIGCCRDLASRIAQIQTHCPETLIILGVMAGKRETETKLHERFAQYRRHGEWFSPVSAIFEFTEHLPKHLPAEQSEGRRALSRILETPTDALIERIAMELGIPDGTVRKWRSRGKVPHHVRHPIAERAYDQGYIIRSPSFDSFGRAASETEAAA